MPFRDTLTCSSKLLLPSFLMWSWGHLNLPSCKLSATRKVLAQQVGRGIVGALTFLNITKDPKECLFTSVPLVNTGI